MRSKRSSYEKRLNEAIKRLRGLEVPDENVGTTLGFPHYCFSERLSARLALKHLSTLTVIAWRFPGKLRDAVRPRIQRTLSHLRKRLWTCRRSTSPDGGLTYALLFIPFAQSGNGPWGSSPM